MHSQGRFQCRGATLVVSSLLLRAVGRLCMECFGVPQPPSPYWLWRAEPEESTYSSRYLGMFFLRLAGVSRVVGCHNYSMFMPNCK